MAKKRPKKRTKTKTPWGMQQTIAMSLLAHAVVVVSIIALGWRQFTAEAPGSTIFVHEVRIKDGGGDGRGATIPHEITSNKKPQQQTHVTSLLPRGEGGSFGIAQDRLRPVEGEAQVKAPSPQPSPGGEGDSNSISGNSVGINVGNGTGTNSNGSGTGAAGNPILAEIRRRIEQSKRYPSQAREQHIEGKVGIQFLIQPNGQVGDIRVSRSSGVPVLDDAAIRAVRHSAPLPYYENTIDLSLAFRLR